MNAAEAFAVLDLKPGASAAEIEAAYKAAVRAWHPDRFSTADMKATAEARLKRINEARTVLATNSRPAESTAEDLQYVDEQARYYGSDPRLPTPGLLDLGGGRAAVCVTSAGILLLVFKNPQTPDRMEYPRDFILRMHHGTRAWGGQSQRLASVTRDDRCVVLSRDPNGLESRIRVELQFRNAYYAKLFAKSAADLLALPEVDNRPKPDSPTPPPRPRQSPPPPPTPLQADSFTARPNRSPGSERQKQPDDVLEKSIPRGCILAIAVTVWTFMIGGLLIAPLLQNGEEITKPSSVDPSERDYAQAPKEITNSIGMKLVLIPKGTFQMGSPPSEKDSEEATDDERQHDVTISKDYHLGVHEVTQEQYERVMGNNPSRFKGDQNPVEQVSWEDAVEFCKRVSALPEEKAAGRVYRLPTEAEWEYACRAGSKTRYSFGDSESQLGEYAWFGGNSGQRTFPVGQKRPNAWGLYDIHGNVWELCSDWYGEYPVGAVTDPVGPAGRSGRVGRGGGWYSGAAGCLTARRSMGPPTFRADSLGFRLALSSPFGVSSPAE